MLPANVLNVMAHTSVAIAVEQGSLTLLAHVIFGSKYNVLNAGAQAFVKHVTFPKGHLVSVDLQQDYIHFKLTRL